MLVSISQISSICYVSSTILTFLLIDAILVGWASKNSNNVGARSVSAALYNVSIRARHLLEIEEAHHDTLVLSANQACNLQMSVQVGSIISAYIYQDYDKPKYKNGNLTLVIINCFVIGLFLLTKAYYMWRNRQRDKIWSAMTEQERIDYVNNTKLSGSRRLDFRFAH